MRKGVSPELSVGHVDGEVERAVQVKLSSGQQETWVGLAGEGLGLETRLGHTSRITATKIKVQYMQGRLEREKVLTQFKETGKHFLVDFWVSTFKNMYNYIYLCIYIYIYFHV